MQIKNKIILAGSVPPPYHGSSIYFQHLLNSKINKEFDVHHLDLSDHRNLDNLSRLDLTNVNIAVKNIFRLRKMLKKINPVLVYIPVASNFLPYLRDGLLILTASYFSKAKIVIHLHEGNYFREGFYRNSNPLVKLFIRRSLKKADTAIVLSNNLKYVFKDFVKNIESSPNGINDEFYIERKIKSTEDKTIISFLGNLFKTKGIIDLLNASVILLKKKNNIEFRFAGAWSEKEKSTKQECEKIIKENFIENKIKFEGIVTGEKKKVFLHETDILAFPTYYRYEGFPLVLLEAMSSAVPVISVNDTGAIPDIIDDGVTGILVHKKDPEQLAEALSRLIEDPHLRFDMGKKGREKFLKEYTLEKNINTIISIFNKTLNQYIVK